MPQVPARAMIRMDDAMTVTTDDTPTPAGDFSLADEPFALFANWLRDAEAGEPNDPNAMALATVDADGLPNVRMVLLKGVDGADATDRGFVFYTNLESAKGRELLAAHKAALCFHWKSLRRQVRVRGLVTLVSGAEADAYYRVAGARQPARRVGKCAVATAREPLCAGEGCRPGHREVSDRRDPAPAALVRLPRHAARDRVLARPAVPAARPAGVPPAGRDARRGRRRGSTLERATSDQLRIFERNGPRMSE